jgi:hypothetical protein
MLTLTMLLAIAVLAMIASQMSSSQQQIVFSAKGGNSEDAQDNGNGNNDDSNDETETEETDDTAETTDDTDDTVEATTATTAAGNDPTPGVGNNDNPLGQDNPQPGRVGNADDGRQTSGEGANAGGTVTDPTLCSTASGENNPDCSTTVTANCFGKVIQHEAQEHKEPGSDEGTLGEHSRDPVPEIEGNETPRQGIGNQDQGHPAAHGAFNSQFDEDDEENVNENC